MSATESTRDSRTMNAAYRTCDAMSGARYPTRSATTPQSHSNANMPNPNMDSVRPVASGLARSCTSSSGRQICSSPVARVEKARAPMIAPLRLLISGSVINERYAVARQWRGSMGGVERPRLGVVTEAFANRPLVDVMDWIVANAPTVAALEVGAGGYAPTGHCDLPRLLRDASARKRWLSEITARGLSVAALNVWGNPLHPDEAIATQHDADLRDAVRLAALIGVDRVVALAGCPAGAAGDRTPHFAGGGWLPYLESIHEAQWKDAVAPYWLLDRRWPRPPEEMPWNFGVVGRGHDPAWWRSFAAALTRSTRVHTIAVEHEDPFVPPEEGIPEAAKVLAAPP